jgi:hypothetical protein
VGEEVWLSVLEHWRGHELVVPCTRVSAISQQPRFGALSQLGEVVAERLARRRNGSSLHNLQAMSRRTDPAVGRL